MNKEQIIETLLPWNFWEKDLDSGISREGYLDRLKRYLKTDEIIALSGIRRSGKSTLLLQLLSHLIHNRIPRSNTLVINFEDPKFYSFLTLDFLETIWETYLDYLKPKGTVYLILDEIHKVKGWEHWVRSKYDRKEPVKILVTGSTAELLSSEYSSGLTGRHLQLSVTPLSFREFLKFNGVEIGAEKLWRVKHKKHLLHLTDVYLNLGGFPKVVLTKDLLLQKELLAQYFNDILIKDVSERYKIKEVGKLKNLALFYSTNFTRGYTFNKVKKVADFSLSLDSIHRFSHYLENSFLIDFLPRFSYSLKNQMQAPRKVYLADNGIHNAVAFKFSTDKGKLLENAVHQHLKREKQEIYFFSEKQEVDFLCKEGLKVTEAINVCYDLKDKETYLREISALIEAMKYFGLKESTIIVAEGEGRQIIEQGFPITIIPFYQWALAI
ncbi:MAG: ATP-binding protein [Pseudomonadota bacterium]